MPARVRHKVRGATTISNVDSVSWCSVSEDYYSRLLRSESSTCSWIACRRWALAASAAVALWSTGQTRGPAPTWDALGGDCNAMVFCCSMSRSLFPDLGDALSG